MAIEWYFIQMGVMLLSSYPFALFYSTVVAKYCSVPMRHCYSLLVSLLVYCALFPLWDFLQLLALSLTVFAIVTQTHSHSQQPNPIIPVLVFVLSLGCLVANHLVYQIYAGSTATIGKL